MLCRDLAVFKDGITCHFLLSPGLSLRRRSVATMSTSPPAITTCLPQRLQRVKCFARGTGLLSYVEIACFCSRALRGLAESALAKVKALDSTPSCKIGFRLSLLSRSLCRLQTILGAYSSLTIKRSTPTAAMPKHLSTPCSRETTFYRHLSVSGMCSCTTREFGPNP